MITSNITNQLQLITTWQEAMAMPLPELEEASLAIITNPYSQNRKQDIQNVKLFWLADALLPYSCSPSVPIDEYWHLADEKPWFQDFCKRFCYHGKVTQHNGNQELAEPDVCSYYTVKGVATLIGILVNVPLDPHLWNDEIAYCGTGD